MDIETMWDELLAQGVSEETLQTVVAINGYTTETMCDILFSRTGYRSFYQWEDE